MSCQRKPGGKATTPERPDRARAILKFCNSYSRLPVLIRMWHVSALDRHEWLTLLGEEWTGSDNIGELADKLWATPFADLIDAPGDFRHLLMTTDEYRALKALPDEIEIWRRCYANNKWGLSWSLDRATAESFPRLNRYRQKGQPLLVRARVRKSEVAGLLFAREEAEIIAHLPRHISTSHLSSGGIATANLGGRDDE